MISYRPFWQTLRASKESTYTLIKDHHLSSATIDKLRHNKSGEIGYTENTKGATGKRAVPLRIAKRSNRNLGRWGGYFFLLLQTLTTRLITATMSMQNWNMSEYVTIIHCPPFFLSEGAKRRFPSAKRVGGRPLAVYR